MKNKAIIREAMLSKLRDFDRQEKRRQNALILGKLLATEKFSDAKVIGLYMNLDFEFDLSSLFLEEKEILIPKTLAKGEMIFVKYDENFLFRTKFGLLEPISSKAEVPDLIIVPGLAWNDEGYRVGFGGGYYDRYLEKFKGETLSLVYNFQKVEFEPEAHDHPVKEIFSV